MTIRAVCDTNVIVSALLFRGRLAWLREAWQSGQVVPIVNAATVTELVRVLAYPKFSLTVDEQHDLLGEYLPFAESIDLADPPSAVPAPPDPDDRKFLELAVTAGAAVVITGDPHLLALNGSIEPPIITPAETHRRFS